MIVLIKEVSVICLVLGLFMLPMYLTKPSKGEIAGCMDSTDYSREYCVHVLSK